MKYHNALKSHSHVLQTDNRQFVDKYVKATVEVNATHGNTKYHKNINGEYVYKTNSKGEYVLDKNGEKIKIVDKTYGSGLHTNWHGSRGDDDYLREISADIRIADATANLKIQEYSRDIESMPFHHILPGMVYIGTKER